MIGTEGRPRCRYHVGVASAVIIARRNADHAATIVLQRHQQALGKTGTDVELIDPLLSLHILADELWQWKEACKAMVGNLNEIRYRSNSGEQLRAEIALYERSQDRAAKILADITRLGIEERMERVSSRQTEMLRGAISAAVAELGELLGFDSDQDQVGQVIARHLREVER